MQGLGGWPRIRVPTAKPLPKHEARSHVPDADLPLLHPRQGPVAAARVSHIDEIRVDLEPAQRAQMMALTGRRTVPQIFIGDTHVGGCDDLVELDRRGGLLPLLGSSPSPSA